MKKALKTTIFIIVWLLIWLIFSYIINLQLLFPTPIEIIKRLGELLLTSDFYLSTASSLGRILLGVLIGLFIGVVLAAISSLSEHIYDFFNPLISFFKATPVVAFVFLVNLFIGTDLTVIFICILMVVPIVYANVYQGIISVDKNMIELCKSFKIPRTKQLTALYIPSVMPYFVSSLLSTIGLAWKAGVAAEILCVPANSIGKEIFNAKTYIEYVDLFAWVLTVVILSIIFEFIATKLLNLTLKKFKQKTEASNEN